MKITTAVYKRQPSELSGQKRGLNSFLWTQSVQNDTWSAVRILDLLCSSVVIIPKVVVVAVRIVVIISRSAMLNRNKLHRTIQQNGDQWMGCFGKASYVAFIEKAQRFFISSIKSVQRKE